MKKGEKLILVKNNLFFLFLLTSLPSPFIPPSKI